MTPLLWGGVFTLHALACASFSWICWLLLPNKYQYPIKSSISFLFLFNLLLPIIGIIGTMCSLVIALYLPRKTNNITWENAQKKPLSQTPGTHEVADFGVGALREILIYDTDAKRHFLAISAIRNLPQKDAVPLLQLAIKNLSDDVRLLAYSSLESIETEINESIALMKKRFGHKATAMKAYEIAQQYWELCYLGIAEGVLLNHYLTQAELYLLQANQIQESASTNLLLGRVLLKQNRPSEASFVLNRAKEGDLMSKQVTPYLAEAAYMVGDYYTVRQLMTSFPNHQGDQLSQIKEYWQ